MSDLSDEQLRAIYAWIDAIPLSRPKKNISRDFNDGVLLAEVVAAYFPHLVEIHNYAPANSLKQKMYNFETLNTRVLKKLGYNIPKNIIEDIAKSKAGAIESVLNSLQIKMAKYRERRANAEHHSSPSAGAHNHRERDNIPQSAVRNKQHDDPYDQNRDKRSINHGGARENSVSVEVDEDILYQKEQQIRDLHETVEVLELKVSKLEKVIRLKDIKIQSLSNK